MLFGPLALRLRGYLILFKQRVTVEVGTGEQPGRRASIEWRIVLRPIKVNNVARIARLNAARPKLSGKVVKLGYMPVGVCKTERCFSKPASTSGVSAVPAWGIEINSGVSPWVSW
ncbi:hypothetical protein HORIV_23630 [Vreelandella olivaria]|uniref:Uncharacterized protein n=1 Tax=Vreelandella olivaria TaxID=390919 RepID=A0ABN5WVH7_9GAMM|nr:hypothetical protein HORIV_23630 [Halomonas olivaria]